MAGTAHAKDVQLQQTMTDCIACQNVCLEAFSHCIVMGGHLAEPLHLNLLLDCVEICRTGANFMLRGSELSSRVCKYCAEVCDQCAASCEKYRDDEQMRVCAHMCRSCADSCREMVNL